MTLSVKCCNRSFGGRGSPRNGGGMESRSYRGRCSSPLSRPECTRGTRAGSTRPIGRGITRSPWVDWAADDHWVFVWMCEGTIRSPVRTSKGSGCTPLSGVRRASAQWVRPVKPVSNEQARTQRASLSADELEIAQSIGDSLVLRLCTGVAQRHLRTHNPKVAGSNPAPATKKALGVTTDTKGFLASGFAGNAHVEPVLNVSPFACVRSPNSSIGSLVVEVIVRTPSAMGSMGKARRVAQIPLVPPEQRSESVWAAGSPTWRASSWTPNSCDCTPLSEDSAVVGR